MLHAGIPEDIAVGIEMSDCCTVSQSTNETWSGFPAING
jgi:hypothetical protein